MGSSGGAKSPLSSSSGRGANRRRLSHETQDHRVLYALVFLFFWWSSRLGVLLSLYTAHAWFAGQIMQVSRPPVYNLPRVSIQLLVSAPALHQAQRGPSVRPQERAPSDTRPTRPGGRV